MYKDGLRTIVTQTQLHSCDPDNPTTTDVVRACSRVISTAQTHVKCRWCEDAFDAYHMQFIQYKASRHSFISLAFPSCLQTPWCFIDLLVLLYLLITISMLISIWKAFPSDINEFCFWCSSVEVVEVSVQQAAEVTQCGAENVLQFLAKCGTRLHHILSNGFHTACGCSARLPSSANGAFEKLLFV